MIGAFPHPVIDRVADDTAGAREIGFSIPQRYNASAILFDNLERGNADRIAVTGPDGTLTYGELCKLANRAGNALLSLGLKRGERILFLLDDTPSNPAFFFGAVRAGLVPVLLNTLAAPDLLQFYLVDAAARTIAVDAANASQLTPEAVRDTPFESVIITNGQAGAGHLGRVLHADTWLKSFSDVLEPADTDRNDMALWMYSSGSTGRPKGIVHLQHDLAYVAASYGKHVLQLRADDVCYSVPKIFFSYGFGNSLLFPFSAGAASVLCSARPKPDQVFSAIAKYRPTVFFGLPTLYTMLAKAHANGVDLSSLRLCVSAAEILSHEISEAWKLLSGLDIVECFGSTEMLNVYLSNSEDGKRAGSAGRRVPGYEIKVCDTDGREIADGEEGVLWIRGHSSAPMYWNRPEQTAETMRGDWIYTSDRFTRDPNGFYFFRGRTDELIKVSGQWVYPLEVELCLAEHKAIREVAVVSFQLPDKRMILKAYVVTNEPVSDTQSTTQQLREYVMQTLLPHKCPRLFEYVGELPKTGTGKIDRQMLKAHAIGQVESSGADAHVTA